MRTKMWILERVSKTNDAFYRYHVQGTFSPAAGRSSGDTFSWSVPSLDDPAYDFTKVLDANGNIFLS